MVGIWQLTVAPWQLGRLEKIKNIKKKKQKAVVWRYGGWGGMGGLVNTWGLAAAWLVWSAGLSVSGRWQRMGRFGGWGGVGGVGGCLCGQSNGGWRRLGRRNSAISRASHILPLGIGAILVISRWPYGNLLHAQTFVSLIQL